MLSLISPGQKTNKFIDALPTPTHHKPLLHKFNSSDMLVHQNETPDFVGVHSAMHLPPTKSLSGIDGEHVV